MKSMEAKLDKPPSKEKFQAPDPRKAFQTLFKGKSFREFTSGALSGAMAKTAVGPLETIRTRMIVGVGSKNIVGSFKEVMKEQGWKGLWAGNGINLLRIVPTQAIELCTFESTKRFLTSVQNHWEKNGCPRVQIVGRTLDLPVSWISPVAVSGAVAGVAGTLSCYPLEVLKDRFTVHPGVYHSISHALSKISQEEGPGALYAGLAPTIIGMIPYSTSYYFVYESTKRAYCRSCNKKSLDRVEALLIGAFGGLTSSALSFPLEVARKRLMVGMLEGRRPTNMINIIRTIIEEEGLKGLYRGWSASCLKVMPASGLSWMFYEAWKDFLLIEGSHI